MQILTADYVLPISSAPIEQGAVVIENDKILLVGKFSEIKVQFPEAEVDDFGEAAILPGFVNAHSHLEITAMRGFLDSVEHDFAAWLLKIAKTRDQILTDEDVRIAAVFGALEAARAGVTCFGDIGRFGIAGFEALKANNLRGVLFQETEFSPDNKTADVDFDKLKEKFLHLKETETDLVKVGLSPHSPYTVSRRLFEKIAEYAIAEHIKISTHAAESNEESILVEKGEGFFIGVYEKFGVQWEVPYLSSIEYLDKIGVLKAKPLLAHCVKVSDSEIESIKTSNASIAHCPKSNAKFGHGIAPLEKFLDAQINTGFGSDSVASNNTCDILEEARFAVLSARNRTNKKRFIEPAEALRTATFGGAKSLGLESQIGTLETGKQADIIAISLAQAAQMPVHDINSALIFASNSRDVKMTMVAGKEIYRNGESKVIDQSEIKIKMREIGKRMKEIR
jgi:aminodeoxyfutalosine deaminase